MLTARENAPSPNTGCAESKKVKARNGNSSLQRLEGLLNTNFPEVEGFLVLTYAPDCQEREASASGKRYWTVVKGRKPKSRLRMKIRKKLLRAWRKLFQ